MYGRVLFFCRVNGQPLACIEQYGTARDVPLSVKAFHVVDITLCTTVYVSTSKFVRPIALGPIDSLWLVEPERQKTNTRGWCMEKNMVEIVRV